MISTWVLYFFQLCRADGHGDGIHAQAGPGVGLVCFDVVDTQAQAAADRDKSRR